MLKVNPTSVEYLASLRSMSTTSSIKRRRKLSVWNFGDWTAASNDKQMLSYYNVWAEPTNAGQDVHFHPENIFWWLSMRTADFPLWRFYTLHPVEPSYQSWTKSLHYWAHQTFSKQITVHHSTARNSRISLNISDTRLWRLMKTLAKIICTARIKQKNWHVLIRVYLSTR